MAELGSITTPVVLCIGDVHAEIGHIEVPLITRRVAAIRLPGGSMEVPVTVDGEELRHQIATLLREAATAFEEAPADGD